MAAQKIRILIADDDGQSSRRLCQFLQQHGFDAKVVQNGVEAKRSIKDWQPRLVLADLMLPEANAFELIDFVKKEPKLKQTFTQVIVMSGHNSETNVRQAFQRGAKDYLVKPYLIDDVLKRIVFHCRTHRSIRDMNQKELQKSDDASRALYLTDLVLRQAISTQAVPDTLFNLARMVSMKVDGVRASIINVVDQRNGLVVTSNDDRSATGILLDLNKYPEVLNVYNTNQVIAIENLDQSPELKPIKNMLQNILFNSLIVCPVAQNGQPFGVLSVRMPPEREHISDNEIRFVEVVAHVISLVLSSENFKKTGEFWRLPEVEIPLAFPGRFPKK